jgi:hypothetical protein
VTREESDVTRTTVCPKCSATLPRKGRFCLECGLDLYEEGVHHRPVPWLPILLGVVGAAIAAVAIVARSAKPSLPPENEQVRALTRELMGALARQEYRDVVRRFCKPDKERYDEVHRLLSDIVRGEVGQAGLNVFRTRCMNDAEEAKRFAREFGAEHVDYVVAVLAALTFEDGALRGEFGGALTGVDRTEAFLAWYLHVVFLLIDASSAEIAEVGWKEGPEGDMLMVATMSYAEPGEARPGLPDPRYIPWRRLGAGQWALAIADGHLLDEVLAVLGRAKM